MTAYERYKKNGFYSNIYDDLNKYSFLKERNYR